MIDSNIRISEYKLRMVWMAKPKMPLCKSCWNHAYLHRYPFAKLTIAHESCRPIDVLLMLKASRFSVLGTWFLFAFSIFVFYSLSVMLFILPSLVCSCYTLSISLLLPDTISTLLFGLSQLTYHSVHPLLYLSLSLTHLPSHFCLSHLPAPRSLLF